MRFVSNEGEAGAGLVWRASRVVPYTGSSGHESWSRPPCGHHANLFASVWRKLNETKTRAKHGALTHSCSCTSFFNNYANDYPIGERHYMSSS